MLEFNLFLIDYWYFSVPLFFFIFLFAYSEMNKGGKKIEPNELTRLVNKENATLIDLRKKEDYENGHIMTALSYPHQEFDNQMHELDKFKERPVILVCDMGRNFSKYWRKTQKSRIQKNIQIERGNDDLDTRESPRCPKINMREKNSRIFRRVKFI